MTQYTQIRSTPLSDKRGSCLRNALVLLVAAAVPMQAVAGDALLRFDSRQELLDAGDELLADLDPEVSGLRIEDFSDSFIRFLPRGEFAACTEPVSSDSSDACFAPGVLEPGFSLTSHNRFGIIMLGADLLGDSMVLEDSAYEVVYGWVAVSDAPARAATGETSSPGHSDAEALARFLAQNL